LFKPFSGQVNYPELELRIIDFWREQRIFERLQEQLRDAPLWSFLDGPITANNPMGVHHAWGRTYKDIFCRFRAMRGWNQRWQNGFDCQGLWVEVEVEKALGLNSKRDIEAFGLEQFSRECRKRVETFAERIAQQSIRLGQWMRWHDADGAPTSYFTFDDNNIEHIWHFLKKCDELGWLTLGHRSMPWCWRCGTSLSQHELVDSYIDKTDPSCFFKCKIIDRPGESFLVWTTTPWTLTSNVALALKPDLNYLKLKVGDEVFWCAEPQAELLFKEGEIEWLGAVKGEELLGLSYRGPMENLPVQESVRRRTIPWDAIGLEEGTGIVHIAPGCGAEDFELGKALELDTIVPIDENGYFVPGLGWLEGKHVTESAAAIRDDLAARGVLFKWGDYRHRYPVCWRCKTPLVFRLVEEWFIRCDEIRPRMKRAAEGVKFIPDYGQAFMQNWLDNMGDWCISRRRFWGLPLPVYVCDCGQRTVIGSKAELRTRAVDPAVVDALPELHRPWIDAVKLRCECGAEVTRITEVGDCWLDAGIVPFSTLDYLPERGVDGATRSLRNPKSQIANPKWSQCFPANWISEMREQIRLWFYSMLFMSVTLEDRAPYEVVLTYEEMRDEKGNAFSKSGGNAIWFDEAAEKMGADPMRWQFAGAPLNLIFRFGYGAAIEIKRKLLTLWNCYGFFAMYANLPDSPPLTTAPTGVADRSELDRWILARLNSLVRGCNESLEAFDAARVTREVEKFVEELSTWYIRRSRRRVWKSDDPVDKRNCLQTLYEVLVTLSKIIAPIIPFSAEELYQSLVPPVDATAPASVHLCEYPQPNDALDDAQLVADMDDVRAVVNLAHAARTAAKIKVRQPLQSAYLHAHGNRVMEDWLIRHGNTIRDEINVKRIQLVASESELPDYGGSANCGGIVDRGWSVLLDFTLTDDLRHEGLARDFVRFVQDARKKSRLNVSDRIEVTYVSDEAIAIAIAAYADYIMRETLALKLERVAELSGDGYQTTVKVAGQPVPLQVVKVNE